ncbi:MAG TPA: hypothetical protein VH413_16320 [Verrucomicrobiae bacterium]|nr:hypothetical protein [Verrucomicrobiae bacterium]
MNRWTPTLNRFGGGTCEKSPLPSPYNGHRGNSELDDVYSDELAFPEETDPRWPTRCDHCGYLFKDDDSRSLSPNRHWRNPATEETFVAPLPVGALFFSDEKIFQGPGRGMDGRSLVVVMPSARDYCTWNVDSRAGNCTVPCKTCGQLYAVHGNRYDEGKKEMVAGSGCKKFMPADDDKHRCWTRRGEPPNVTVGKSEFGPTCGAGAGSIIVPGWHGFLRNGVLEPC